MDEDSNKFSLTNDGKVRGNIRLHAFGVRDNATVEQARARFAICLTSKSQWLSSEELTLVKQGEVDGAIFSKAFSHQLKLLMHPEDNWSCVCHMVSKLDEVCNMNSVAVEVWTHSIHYFCYVAALMAENIGCRTMVVVVEISV